jgi:NAD(P)-dependent dehydrogenase (short-subunit alcohol dehydrogenase family)
MAKYIDLANQVAIVTGGGGGLGRAHALALASRGAIVVVNDFGGERAGTAADAVVTEIIRLGGRAAADCASVTDAAAIRAMVDRTISKFGRIDILVNNAGILRDKTFAKMTLDDFRAVLEVHLMGAVNCTHAIWPHMAARSYGRVVFTTSASGLYGNFGQANYSTAKMALVGLMKTLSIEGAKHNIRVNCLAPNAATRMTESVMAAEMLHVLRPEAVSPAVIVLVGPDAPTQTILCAGGGTFEVANVTLTKGLHIGASPDAPERILETWPQVTARAGETVPVNALAQADNEVRQALATGC